REGLGRSLGSGRDQQVEVTLDAPTDFDRHADARGGEYVALRVGVPPKLDDLRHHPIVRLGRGRCGRRAVRVRWTQPALAAVLEWTSPVARLFFAPAVRVRSECGPSYGCRPRETEDFAYQYAFSTQPLSISECR